MKFKTFRVYLWVLCLLNGNVPLPAGDIQVTAPKEVVAKVQTQLPANNADFQAGDKQVGKWLQSPGVSKTIFQKPTPTEQGDNKVWRKFGVKIPNRILSENEVKYFFWSLALSLCLLMGGLSAFVLGLHQYRLGRLIQNTPLAKVRSAALGMVELEGQVACDTPLTSPLFSKPCAYFKYQVKAEDGEAEYGTIWKSLLDQKSEGVFYLEDDTGRILIDPSGAKFEDVWQKQEGIFGEQHEPLPISIQQFLESEGVKASYTGMKATKMILISESRLNVGQAINVFGPVLEREHLKSFSSIRHENLVVGHKRGDKRWFVIGRGSWKEEVRSKFAMAKFAILGGGLASVVGLIWLECIWYFPNPFR